MNKLKHPHRYGREGMMTIMTIRATITATITATIIMIQKTKKTTMMTRFVISVNT